MKAFCVLTILVVAFTGCRRDTLPGMHGIEVRWDAHFHPIPPGRYDARFICGEATGRYTKDSIHKWYDASAYFYDSDRMIRMPGTVSVSVNGNLLKQGINEPVQVNFPEPVTWQIKGNKHFPSVTHTLASFMRMEILSPNETESVSPLDSTEVRYSAPGLDSVQFLLSYRGTGVFKRDTTKIEETGQDYYKTVPNSGRYVIAPFKMYGSFLKSFKPEKLLVIIMWSRGDTVHVGPYVYGFVNSCGCSHRFALKP